MGIFSFFKKENRSSESNNMNQQRTKEDVFRELFKQFAQSSPSSHFASGAVFDIV